MVQKSVLEMNGDIWDLFYSNAETLLTRTVFSDEEIKTLEKIIVAVES